MRLRKTARPNDGSCREFPVPAPKRRCWGAALIGCACAAATVLLQDNKLVRTIKRSSSSTEIPSDLSASASASSARASSASVAAKDACGLLDNSTKHQARWVPYDDRDVEYLALLEPCIHRLEPPPHQLHVTDFSVMHKLVCPSDVGNHDGNRHQNIYSSSSGSGHVPFFEMNWHPAYSTLAHYNQVLFLGDSILRQQFMALICSLNPHLTLDAINVHNGNGLHYQYKHIFPAQKDSANLHATTFTMYKIGHLFGTTQGFFETHYPEALKTFTNRDAIVLNAGVHYHSYDAHYLQHTILHLAEKSQGTNATVLLMEPSNTEWATRSGTWSKICMWKCQCEPLDEARLAGLGALSGNTTYSEATPHQPHVETFLELYPQLPQEQWDLTLHNNSNLCIPDCLPASWRADLVRASLQKIIQTQTRAAATTNHTKQMQLLTLVPVFWQLVALDMHTKEHTGHHQGDCTHKDVKSILFMNAQLLRYMRQRQHSTAPIIAHAE